jgi:hypothetical protein
MTEMTEYDRRVLAEIAEPGSQEGLAWGAAMSVSLEYLRGKGYVTRSTTPQITGAGREALKAV